MVCPLPEQLFLAVSNVTCTDPAMKQEYLPFDLVKESQHVVLAVTEKGGHVGWFTHPDEEEVDESDAEKMGLQRWYNKPIIEFFEAIRQVCLLFPCEG